MISSLGLAIDSNNEELANNIMKIYEKILKIRNNNNQISTMFDSAFINTKSNIIFETFQNNHPFSWEILRKLLIIAPYEMDGSDFTYFCCGILNHDENNGKYYTNKGDFILFIKNFEKYIPNLIQNPSNLDNALSSYFPHQDQRIYRELIILFLARRGVLPEEKGLTAYAEIRRLNEEKDDYYITALCYYLKSLMEWRKKKFQESYKTSEEALNKGLPEEFIPALKENLFLSAVQIHNDKLIEKDFKEYASFVIGLNTGRTYGNMMKDLADYYININDYYKAVYFLKQAEPYQRIHLGLDNEEYLNKVYNIKLENCIKEVEKSIF